MAKVICEEKKVDDLLERGVEIIYPDKESLRQLLLSGKRIRLYCGFDPSAASLHIGNAILINKLAQFQSLGHEVIFLIGDFTGMIGDPTDKLAVRKKLTREEVSANSASYRDQAKAYLEFEGENPAQILYNSQWSDSLTFKDLIEVASNFTVGQMIQRDMFQKRIADEKPIHLHEFLYPLAQGYDSVAMDVDLEIGGNDQMFNMMCGRDLMKAIKGKEKFVITMKLLTDDKGKKMGKSEGNAVFLDGTPENIYGAIMSWADGVIVPGFELCTKLPREDIELVKNNLEAGANPRDYKMQLAREITALVHGEEKAAQAEDFFRRTVQLKEIPEDIAVVSVKDAEWKLADLLVEAGLAPSKSEARRLIEQGGIKVGGQTAADPNQTIALTGQELLLQKGKRGFVKVIIN